MKPNIINEIMASAINNFNIKANNDSEIINVIELEVADLCGFNAFELVKNEISEQALEKQLYTYFWEYNLKLINVKYDLTDEGLISFFLEMPYSIAFSNELDSSKAIQIFSQNLPFNDISECWQIFFDGIQASENEAEYKRLMGFQQATGFQQGIDNYKIEGQPKGLDS